MDRSITVALGAIGAVALVGFVGRRLAKRNDEMPGVIRTDVPPPDMARANEQASGYIKATPEAGPESGPDVPDAEPARETGEAGAVSDEADDVREGGEGFATMPTADGRTFVADPLGVWLVPRQRDEKPSPASRASTSWRRTQSVETGWERGGLAGVRIVKGGPNEWPWSLQMLGPDGDFNEYPFDSHEAAHAVLVLMHERNIVQPRVNEDGEVVDSSDESFERALRTIRESEAELQQGLGEGDAYDESEVEEISVAAVTRDGEALVAGEKGVRVLPPPEAGEPWKAGTQWERSRGLRVLEHEWSAGTYVGGRVVAGEGEDGPWRMEVLGSEGEYGHLEFAAREEADAALELMRVTGVIRPLEKGITETVEPSDAEYDEARRITAEAAARLERINAARGGAGAQAPA